MCNEFLGWLGAICGVLIGIYIIYQLIAAIILFYKLKPYLKSYDNWGFFPGFTLELPQDVKKYQLEDLESRITKLEFKLRKRNK